jgi:peptidoglycan/xylan/chitin deacetylase (PgdA/CDA1 family)
MQSVGVRGTFYSLTSISRKHPELVKELAKNHEIGYHGDVHIGFKGKNEDEQSRRMKNMVVQMRESVGEPITSSISGFRAPTESYDKTTDKLLRQIGVTHHVTDPSASEGRLPYFSNAETDIDPESQVIGLPRTQRDDLNYKSLQLSNEVTQSRMLAELDLTMRMGALGVLSIHSQNYGDGGSMAFATPPYLKKLTQNTSHAWVATGKEIAEWWRMRNRVSLKGHGKSGENAVTLLVKAPGNVKGVTLMVSNPSKTSPLKSLAKTQGDIPAYRIQAIDEFRSAIIFDKLEVGEYRFNLQF